MRRFFSFLLLGFLLLVLAMPGSAKAQENVLALPDGKSTAQSVVKWCLSTATPPTAVPCNASNAIPDTVTSTDGGAAITGATMPSGGAWLTGWLSAIWSKLSGALSITAPPQTFAAPTFSAVNNTSSSIITAGTYAHFILICTLTSSTTPVYFGIGSAAVIGSGIVISPGGGCVNFGGTSLPVPASGQAINAITATGQNVAIQGG